METDRLRHFCSVVETGNLRKASELLGITHGGLSKSLKTLEREVAKTLFLPAGRGLALTDEGRAFYDRAKEFLKNIEILLASGTSNEKDLRIGTFEVFSTYFLPEVLSKEFAGYQVALHELVPGKLEEALSNHRIDIGITYEPIPQPGLDYLKAGEILMAVYGAQKFRKVASPLDLPFVAPNMPLEGAPSGVRGLDGFPDDKIPRTIRYRVDMLQTALQLVSEGAAIGFFPSFLVQKYNQSVVGSSQLYTLETSNRLKIKRAVYIVKRTSSPESVEIKKMAKALRHLEH